MVAEVYLAYAPVSAAVLLTMPSGAIVATEELARSFRYMVNWKGLNFLYLAALLEGSQAASSRAE
jgi:hypothetical protein